MKERVPEREKVLTYLIEDSLVELAKNLIRIPSATGSESEVARFLERYMKDSGLETELIETEAGRFQPVGWIRGRGKGYSLLFNGHMDTEDVKIGEEGSLEPRIEGRKLYGHGIYNMKGGVAAMVEAAVAIKKSGVNLKGDLIVTPVVGELQGSFGTAINVKRGIKADFGLVPEPYDEFLSLTHVGCEEIAITLRGRSEATGNKERGINLAVKMAKVIDALDKMKFTYTPDVRYPAGPKMIVGSVICGHGETYSLKGANFLPDLCTMVLDIRYLPGMLPHQDIKKVLEEIKGEDSEFNYEMKVTPRDLGFPGMPWENFRLTIPFQDVPPEELIVKVYAENYKCLTGKEPRMGAIPSDDPKHYKMYWINDDSVLTKAGTISFCCGPVGEGSLSKRNIDLDSMMTVAKTMALTAYDICTTSKE